MVAPVRRGVRAAALGLIVNSVLAIVKLITGVVGHSFVLVADAVESMADVATSSVVIGGLHIASRPADEEHPYGHGKADSLAALVVAQVLLVAAIGIAVQAVREVLHPSQAPAAFTLWVLIGVIVIKEGLYRLVWKVGTQVGSTAVTTEAWHHRSDALTSFAALIGIMVARVGGEGYEAADDWAALVVSVVVAVNGVRFLRRALGDLMDAHAPAEIERTALQAAVAVEGVRGVEKVLTRKMGLVYLIDMHLEVDPAISVSQAHEIAHRAKDHIISLEPRIGDVLMHVEPARPRPAPDNRPSDTQT